MSRTHRILRVLITAAIALFAPLTFTTPANAWDAKECTNSAHKEFDTTGTNVTVYIQLCVWRTGSTYDAEAYVNWGGGGGLRKFDAFRMEVRLEKNDAAMSYNDCNLVSAINENSTGSRDCGTAARSGSGSGWTADATVLYNLDLDGEGEKFWDLTGTPKI
ncbi:hypothetical protein ACFV46_23140 [Streptomyces sp. NPDC059852]|uniref:hypothetical protein n=1 Tax=Streptomyces sp. NPDC059852 TaxID=3346972 RepID=UPI00364DB159